MNKKSIKSKSKQSSKSKTFSKNDPNIQKIKKSSLMWKFRFYGFFKNLRFFEPFLLIMLLEINLSLLQIGFLIFIQELITYILEIPSGILADKSGRKKILMSCFVFYIISFVLYFIGIEIGINNEESSLSYIVICLAAFAFGFGEAFRSGSHKAMELMWMEKNELLDYKAYIYGSTRSYSLIGSALSALLGIIFALSVPAKNWIFLIRTIPYFIDFFLIMSYPSYMDETSKKSTTSFLSLMKEGFRDLIPALKNKKLRNGLISSSLFDAIYKSLKDYIQPLMEIYLIILIQQWQLTSQPEDTWLSITLGVLYFIFYIFSSVASKNAYKIKIFCQSSKKVMDLLFDIFSFVLLFIGIFILVEIPVIIIIFYLLIYILENIRRPNAVDYLSEIIPAADRATLLSVEHQLKAIFMLCFAPLFGFIADWNIGFLFLLIAVVAFILNRFLTIGRKELCGEEEKVESEEKPETTSE